MSRNGAGKKKNSDKKKRKSPIREVLEVVIPAVLIFLVVRTFFFESRWVPSPSMVPTIQTDDHFLENKLVYRFGPPKRGDIVVFHPPEMAVEGTGNSDDFVKRVIGLPGETVEIRQGRTYIDGQLLDEPYVPADEMDYLSFGPFHVPEGELFVMGDNRRQSRDSRYWLYVPIGSVTGKAWLRFWPLNHISVLK